MMPRGRSGFLRSVLVSASLGLWLLLALAWLRTQQAGAQAPPEKVGAGILLCSAGKVLLLQRDSNHNDGAWGMPGGNKEDADSSLLATASREAREELGLLPPFSVKAQILTKRGKRQQKHFTVFVAEPGRGVANSLGASIKLSDENKAWRWVPWQQVKASAAKEDSDDDYGDASAGDFVVHPTLTRLARDHERELARALPSCVA